MLHGGGNYLDKRIKTGGAGNFTGEPGEDRAG